MKKGFLKIFVAIIGFLFVPIFANGAVIELGQEDFDNAPDCDTIDPDLDSTICKRSFSIGPDLVYNSYYLTSGEYKLTDDIIPNGTIHVSWEEVTLDLDGYGLGAEAGYFVQIDHGSLTVKGDGYISAPSLFAVTSGNLTIKNGSFSGSSSVFNGDETSNIIIEDGRFTANHWENIFDIDNGDLTILNGYFDNSQADGFEVNLENADPAIHINGNVTIENGVFKSLASALDTSIKLRGAYNLSDVTINNGNFISSLGYGVYAVAADTVNINGGVFTGVNAGLLIGANEVNLRGGYYRSTANNGGAIEFYGNDTSFFNSFVPEGYYYYPSLDASTFVDDDTSMCKTQQEIAVFEDYDLGETGYLITFEPNNSHSSLIDVQPAVKGENTILRKNGFINPGFYFNGWNTKDDGSGSSYSDEDTVTFNDDVTLYAMWEPMNFTVIYDGYGGTGSVESQQSTYGEDLYLRSNGFTKTGYIFGGWGFETSGMGDKLGAGDLVHLTPEENNDTIILFAQWDPIWYLVNYDANGSEFEAVGAWEPYDRSFEIESVTEVNHVLVGWNTEPDGTGTWYYPGDYVVNLTDQNNQTITLYAIWNVADGSITYNANNGTDSTYTQVITKETTTKLHYNEFEYSGYVFEGWNTKADGTGVSYTDEQEVVLTEDLVLYAQWRPMAYTINYYGNGGSGVVESQELVYGNFFHPRANNFTKEGYKFIGWTQGSLGGNVYTELDNIMLTPNYDNDEIYFWANWEPISYTVEYNANGGTGTMDPIALDYDEEYLIEESAFERNGYTFIGWSTNPDGSGIWYSPKSFAWGLTIEDHGTVTLYAQWQANSMIINYDANGGTGDVEPQEYDIGDDVILRENEFTAPTGYKFRAWSRDNSGEGDLYNENELIHIPINDGNYNVTMFAIWEPITYYIAYYANGGTGSMEDQTVHYNEYVTIKQNEFTREGYFFTGWNTSPDGTGTDREAGSTVRNLTTSDNSIERLYAQWSSTTYDLVYDANGGTGSMEGQQITIGNQITFHANEFAAPTGYKFEGWSFDASGTGPIYGGTDQISYTPTQSTVTVYAIWTPITYTIVYDLMGGTGSVEPQVVRYGETVLTPIPNNLGIHKEGYGFICWNTEPDGSGDTYYEAFDLTNLTTEDNAIVTLYAIWDIIPITVTFDANGGTVDIDSKEVIYGLPYGDLPIPKKGDYAFDGWYLGINRVVPVNDVYSIRDHTLVARWHDGEDAERWNTIIYDKNGSTTGWNKQDTFRDATTYTFYENNSYQKPGYTVVGWNTKPDGTGTHYDFEQNINVADIPERTFILYAEWEEINIDLSLSESSIDFGTNEINFPNNIKKTITLTDNSNVKLKLYLENPTSDGPFGSMNFCSGCYHQSPTMITFIANANSPFAGEAGTYNGTYQLIAKDQFDNELARINIGATITLTAPLSIKYRTHIQDIGWQEYKADGAMAGTSGQSKRLEGIKIKLENAPYEGDIEYRTHIQDIGWQEFKKNDQMSGTSGQSKRLEAIEIRLTGEMAEHYDVYYRVHAQQFGWLGWARNGEKSGTANYAYRLEAIEIKLVPKGELFEKYGKAVTFYDKIKGETRPLPDNAMVAYQTHVQDYGWQSYVPDGETSGTVGKSKRLEGIKIRLVNQPYSGDIEYRTHIQDYGWETSFKKNDEMSGTSGKSKRLEAIEIRLTGEMADHYDIYYRVHAQQFGWLGWARNGEKSGTQGYAYRLEGIQIKIVPKGQAFSGYGSTVAFIKK